MKKSKDYWSSVFDMFFNDHPVLAGKMVDWYPSAQYEITVKTDDGCKYAYDMFTRVAYKTYDSDTPLVDISEEEWRKGFAKNLNRKLHNVAMTQDMLAYKTGISQVMISKYTRGKATPSANNVEKMAIALKCSTAELMNVRDLLN